MTMKTGFLVTATALLVLCGCTSFDVFIEVPNVEPVNVALYANAVAGVHKLESGEAIKLPSGVWRVRLKEGKTMIRLPFVPNELLLSVNAEGKEGVFRVISEENEQGSLTFKVKSVTGGTKSWAIDMDVKDQAAMTIKISMGKSK